ncbi:hypothetical protein P7C70_g4337, partial [Phenoliferia sp. Uapishka_3]
MFRLFAQRSTRTLVCPALCLAPAQIPATARLAYSTLRRPQLLVELPDSASPNRGIRDAIPKEIGLGGVSLLYPYKEQDIMRIRRRNRLEVVIPGPIDFAVPNISQYLGRPTRFELRPKDKNVGFTREEIIWAVAQMYRYVYAVEGDTMPEASGWEHFKHGSKLLNRGQTSGKLANRWLTASPMERTPSLTSFAIEFPLVIGTFIQQFVQVTRSSASPTEVPQQSGNPPLRRRTSPPLAGEFTSSMPLPSEAPRRSGSRTREPALQLSTSCENCGDRVDVVLPPWLTSALEDSRGRSGRDYQHYSQPPKNEWRDGVVGTAVQMAQAVKASPLPGLLWEFALKVFAFMAFLNVRYNLVERAVVILSIIFEGLLEVEKEAGLFRSAGELISVLWEATIKSAITLARAEPAGHQFSPYTSHAKSSRVHSQPANFPAPTYSYPSTPVLHPVTRGFNTPPIFASSPDENDIHPLDEESHDNSHEGSHHPSASALDPRLRTLRRTPYSSPSLPLLVSRSSSSSNLQPPFLASGSGSGSGSQSYSGSPGSSPPEYYSSYAHPPRTLRHRSRSAHADERNLNEGEEEVEVRMGWAARAGRVAGAVGRMGARVSGVASGSE